MQTAMDGALRHLLEALYEEGARNDAHEQERRRKLLNLEPETAHLLSVLVQSGRRKRLLEIGTSNGYSTIWLAWAVQTTGGQIISIDREVAKQEQAAANLQRAGLRGLVELRCGDATELVADVPGPFDFVFFDADRFSAPAQLKLLSTKLTEDVLLCADNVQSHPDEIAGYLQAIEALPEFEHMVIPVGKGLSLAYRAAANVHKP
ncbi:O-methyltransferase [Reticulibacter mediterranei]|uniref:O-methyltransferase n=1 Tax=Reticulibacter mediterranei TaxID=2778369 RepID=A0A8J3IK91_9CHLR|nr:class I SAM-dependent methyltransferase [Reticulibacter mediterranei]GHO95328.1 O-methyltransferase [Reticulibacter mediterranei]